MIVPQQNALRTGRDGQFADRARRSGGHIEKSCAVGRPVPDTPAVGTHAFGRSGGRWCDEQRLAFHKGQLRAVATDSWIADVQVAGSQLLSGLKILHPNAVSTRSVGKV